ncbi:hypothetical protein D3C80_1904040 [compost metagenome]
MKERRFAKLDGCHDAAHQISRGIRHDFEVLSSVRYELIQGGLEVFLAVDVDVCSCMAHFSDGVTVRQKEVVRVEGTILLNLRLLFTKPASDARGGLFGHDCTLILDNS